MDIQALFLDCYGTIVHEDDDIIPIVCNLVKESASIECTEREIGNYWWKQLSRMFHESWGDQYELQRNLSIRSLQETLQFFQSDLRAEEIIQVQFQHWVKPGIFADTKPFLEALEIPVYILSNIDTADVLEALQFHQLDVAGVITSEEVRSYKPRPEMFREALGRFRLNSNEVLHIGDSLHSDVQGAQNASIQAIWLNRKQRVVPEDRTPDNVCHHLLEVIDILTG